MAITKFSMYVLKTKYPNLPTFPPRISRFVDLYTHCGMWVRIYAQLRSHSIIKLVKSLRCGGMVGYKKIVVPVKLAYNDLATLSTQTNTLSLRWFVLDGPNTC